MKRLFCTLPGGYVDDIGEVHREAEIIQLSGQEEEVVATSCITNSAQLVSTVLGHCVHHIGSFRPFSEEVARKLIVADRQFLLIKLRQITFGEHVQGTIRCPLPDCGKKVDIDFSINDLQITESEDRGPTYKLKLSAEAAFKNDDGKEYRDIVFRLPNGEDQEIISPLISQDESHALLMLLERCIQSIGPHGDPDAELIRKLSPAAFTEIENAMETVSPRVDLSMTAICPECNREFDVPFDLESFFLNELRTSMDLLSREVHYLAYHYHWSERDIMNMSRQKRHKYIEILADEIEKLNNAI